MWAFITNKIFTQIDEKGKEKSLGENFRNFMGQAALKFVRLIKIFVYHQLSDVILGRYESFDFHKECRKMQWHKLSLLTDRLSTEQLQFKYV